MCGWMINITGQAGAAIKKENLLSIHNIYTLYNYVERCHIIRIVFTTKKIAFRFYTTLKC